MISLGHQKTLRSFQTHCRGGLGVNLLELDLFCLTKKVEVLVGVVPYTSNPGTWEGEAERLVQG